MNRGLIIFAREPVPGRVKTRLAASIGERAAAELYETMLQDVLKASQLLSDVKTVVFWDCEEESLPLLAERYRCHSRRQSQGDLGGRMQTAFEELFAEGFEACCIIGSDAPDLPVASIADAFDALATRQADVVYGPSSDGGYYLLGLRRIIPPLFLDIAWGTPRVLQQSLAAAERVGAQVVLLPEWYDIDTLEDLNAFRKRSQPATAIPATEDL